MSALGQKRTYAVHQGMSALPPIATTKATSLKNLYPLYPKSGHVQRTSRGQLRANSRHSVIHFDHLVRNRNRQFANKTGKAAFSKTCWVAPPNIHCRNRLCV
jgi:hypothetical protein